MNPIILGYISVVALAISIVGILPLLRRVLKPKAQPKQKKAFFLFAIVTGLVSLLSMTVMFFVLRSDIFTPPEIPRLKSAVDSLRVKLDGDSMEIYLSGLYKIRSPDVANVIHLGIENYVATEYEKAVGSFNSALILVKDTSQVRISVLSLLGVSQFNSKDFTGASITYKQIVDLASLLKDTSAMINGLWKGGFAYQEIDYLDSAFSYHKRLLDIFQKENSEIPARLYFSLGSISLRPWFYDTAIIYYQYALGVDKQGKDFLRIIEDYSNLGKAYLALGKTSKAIVYLDSAYAIAKKKGEQEIQTNILYEIGQVHEEREENDKAIEYYFKALKKHEETVNLEAQVRDLRAIAGVYLKEKASYLALDYYRRVLTINHYLDEKKGIAEDLGNIGCAYRQMGGIGLDTAFVLFDSSLNMALELNDSSLIAEQYGNIGSIYHLKAEYKEASNYYWKSIIIYENLGLIEGQAGQYSNLGTLYRELGDILKACNYYCKARELYYGEQKWKKGKEINNIMIRLNCKEILPR